VSALAQVPAGPTAKLQLSLQFPSEEASYSPPSSAGQTFLLDGQAAYSHQETSFSLIQRPRELVNVSSVQQKDNI
jgi:hypothetical protein